MNFANMHGARSAARGRDARTLLSDAQPNLLARSIKHLHCTLFLALINVQDTTCIHVVFRI